MIVITRRVWTRVAAAALAAAASASADRPIICPNPFPLKSTTGVAATDPNGRDFHEISGIAISPTRIGPSGDAILFAAADGPRERIGMFDSGNGERLMTLRLPSGLPLGLDWESLTIGSCGSSTRGFGDDCLYVADVGDNVARNTGGRRSARDGEPNYLYKIREPDRTMFQDNDVIPASDVSVLPFDYLHSSSPKDFADCEAIFLDHAGWGEDGEAPGDIYVLTKWNSDDHGLTRLYRIPSSAWPENGSTVAPVFSPPVVGSYDLGGTITSETWTGAEMTVDGTIIALGDYYRTHLFLRCPGQSVSDVLAAPNGASAPCASWDNPFSNDAQQFEATAWTPDGSRNLQISECSGCDNPLKWTLMEYDPATTSQSCEAEPAETAEPSAAPSEVPSEVRPAASVMSSTATPSALASTVPSSAPTAHPSSAPAADPSASPSSHPSASPTDGPSSSPTDVPSTSPTAPPSDAPSVTPSVAPLDAQETADAPAPTMARGDLADINTASDSAAAVTAAPFSAAAAAVLACLPFVGVG